MSLEEVYEEVDRQYLMKKEEYGWVPGCSGASPKDNYYEAGGIEVIDYIKAKLTPEQYKGYLLGNVLKYSGRCNHKGVYKQDIKKLKDYTDWLNEHESNN